MLEIVSKKTKIHLTDYDFEKDLENRLFLSSLNQLELSVLEEITFSSLTTSVSKLSKDLEIEIKKLKPILQKFETVNLISIDKEIIQIDKKTRNYFEFEYERFSFDFKNDLSFVNKLLQKIPIHILPIWYSLPRSLDNIFQSIIEKYLKTPHTFERYVENLEFDNPIIFNIVEDLYNSENFELNSSDIQKKYSLTREDYLTIILFLEFMLLGFISYKNVNGKYIETLSPFYEYKNYLLHLKKTEVSSIRDTQDLIMKRNSPFGFIEDMTSVLNMLKQELNLDIVLDNLSKEISIKDPNIIISKAYTKSVVEKLEQIKLIEIKANKISLKKSAKEFLSLDLEKKALFLFHHPLNDLNLDNDRFSEKNIREAEKSISRAINYDWIYFDDFKNGILAQISENHTIQLIPFGKGYKYTIPTYDKEEMDLLKKVIFTKLFEAGIVLIGSLKGKDCFKVTNLGKAIFDIS